jgi:hypothetical protein
VASAIFQLMMIKVAEFIFGPYNETFALVLATVLLGIAAGAMLSGALRLSFESALIITLVGLALLLALLPSAVSLYALMYPNVVNTYPLLVLLKLGLILALMGVPAIGFGATIPTLLHEHQDVARESGQLLFVSSMANVLGFCLMAFLLHRFFDYALPPCRVDGAGRHRRSLLPGAIPARAGGGLPGRGRVPRGSTPGPRAHGCSKSLDADGTTGRIASRRPRFSQRGVACPYSR